MLGAVGSRNCRRGIGMFCNRPGVATGLHRTVVKIAVENSTRLPNGGQGSTIGSNAYLPPAMLSSGLRKTGLRPNKPRKLLALVSTGGIKGTCLNKILCSLTFISGLNVTVVKKVRACAQTHSKIIHASQNRDLHFSTCHVTSSVTTPGPRALICRVV